MARPRKKPAEKPIHVVRTWVSSPVVYGYDSRFDRKPNPDHHEPIALTSDGEFVVPTGETYRRIEKKDVPAYILEQAKGTNLDTTYYPPQHRELSMTDAMLGAGVQDTDPDPAVRRGRSAVAPRVRKVYA